MTTPNLAPVDESVPVPRVVREAAERANAVHKEAYGEPTPPLAPPAATPPQTPAATPPATPQTAADAPPTPTPEELQGDTWAARYNSMKGRFDQSQRTIGSMQQQMSEMGDELMRMQQVMEQRGQQRTFAQQPDPPPQPLVTPEDKEKFGEDLIDFVSRVSRASLAPDLRNVQTGVQRIGQRVAQTAQAAVFTDLDREVPNWRALNHDPRFKAWCALRDIYSGNVRGQMLNAAIQAGDAPRAVAFFKGFLAEEQATGQVSTPQDGGQQTPAPRTPAVPLETLTAPGAARPASGSGDQPQVPADRPIITRQQISWFYSQEGRRYYTGRDDQRKADEAQIFAAQREGRVKG